MRTRPAPAAADTAYDGGERPSKTQLKQQAHELQTLGLALAALPDDRFAAIAMPERLREAIAEYRRTRSHEGRRRQMQYVGKCMRLADPAPLREAVAAYQLGSARDTLALHEVERWRDELIADDGALDRWTLTHPDTDLQRLRSLVRAARRDAQAAPQQRQARAYRELFQFIKPVLASLQAQPPGAPDGADDAQDDAAT